MLPLLYIEPALPSLFSDQSNAPPTDLPIRLLAILDDY